MSISSFELSLSADVTAAMQGSEPALTRVLGRCRHVVTSIALAIVRDLDASEEVAQEVFVQVWKQLPKLRKPASFMPWLRQLTRRRALNYLRDERVNKRLSSDEAEQLLLNVTTHTELAQDFAREQQDILVRDLLDKLAPDEREVVMLYYREEQSSQQVAALLGISEANVRKRLQRVRAQLREDWLAAYGKAVLQSSAPLSIVTGVFANAVLPAALSTATPTAVTMTGSASSGGLLAKFAWLFSGAMIGTLVAVVGVIAGMHGPLKAAKTDAERKSLMIIRKWTVIWVVGSGICFALSYALTDGWIGPVTAFLIILSGLIYQNVAVWRVIGPNLREQAAQSEKGLRSYRNSLIGGWFGMVVGYGGGFTGVLLGLWQSGRLFL
ncbi:MAG: sigma-70 family RNA polymerase sigma factor [Idiomarina sp.]|nr:sigma-70 family RNA polymerase sigma factor [Idiomarina sp.]